MNQPAPEPDGGQTVAPNSVRDINRYRNYLLLQARRQLSPRLRGELDPSDVVQGTLLDAHKVLDQFRGSTSGEMAAWLGQILVRKVQKAARYAMQQVRDVRRNVSLWQKAEESSVMLMNELADAGTSPSQQAERNEQLVRLAEALARLPDAQREAVELRFFHHWPTKDIAEHLGRTTAAVGGLVARGLAELRGLLPARSE